MKSNWSSLSLAVVLLVPGLAVVSGQLKLVFDEEFKTFDLTRWQHEITLGGEGNWEFEYYSNNRTNSYVRDGNLYIQPSLLVDDIGEANLMNGYDMDIWGGSPADLCTSNAFYGCSRTSGAGGNYLNPVKSARIRTVESFSFTYGRVEVRAKLPRGDWLWPAIWMLPRDNQYGTWPASGEIDIMESRGNPPSYPAGGYDTFGSTLHFGPAWDADSYLKTHASLKPGSVDLTKDFHVYGLVWNESYIGTYLDHETNTVLSHPITEPFWTLGGWGDRWNNPWVGEPPNAPFNRQFYLVMNVAAGGTNGYFPDGKGGKPWSDKDQHAINAFWESKAQWYPTWSQPLIVDSVKVWSLPQEQPKCPCT